jgi:hypothetical protein
MVDADGHELYDGLSLACLSFPRSLASGAGLHRGHAGKTSTFTVQAKDGFSNDIVVGGCTSLQAALLPHNSSDPLHCQLADLCAIKVGSDVQSQVVGDVPKVVADRAVKHGSSAKNSAAAFTNALESTATHERERAEAQRQRDARLAVLDKMLAGVAAAAAAGSSSRLHHCGVADQKDGSYVFSYTPTVSGAFWLCIMSSSDDDDDSAAAAAAKGSSSNVMKKRRPISARHIMGSPVQMYIDSEKLCPDQVTIAGAVRLPNVAADDAGGEFTIHSRDRYSLSLSLCRIFLSELFYVSLP